MSWRFDVVYAFEASEELPFYYAAPYLFSESLPADYHKINLM
jgi:hypothetical protein